MSDEKVESVEDGSDVESLLAGGVIGLLLGIVLTLSAYLGLLLAGWSP